MRQSREAGLAVGEVRSITEFAKLDWVREWNAIVAVDDRNGGTTPMPGAPAFQGEHNAEICAEANVAPEAIQSLKDRHILLSRRSVTGDFD